MSYLIARLIHLLFMAGWLAAITKEFYDPLAFNGDPIKDKEQNVKREKIAGMLGTVSDMGALISGGVVLYIMGYDSAPIALYVGATIAIVMAFIGAFGVGGVYHYINEAIDKGESTEKLVGLANKLKFWSGTMLLLWLVVFLLMGLRHVI